MKIKNVSWEMWLRWDDKEPTYQEQLILAMQFLLDKLVKDKRKKEEER
jgi:hypothetical protein